VGAIKGWLAAAHPFPLAAVMTLTALVAVASAEWQPYGPRLALLLAAMLGSQLAIGWSNDYLDREADAMYQPWKPVPSGLVRAGLLPYAIVVALAVSAGCGIALGLLPLLLLVAGTACGLAYNLGLKDTHFSGVPFVVALALLPPFVWETLDVYRADYIWLYALGSPLALAAHVANTLPDMVADREAGQRGLVVALGRTRSLWLLGACLVAPLVVFVATLAGVSYETVVSGTESYLIVWVVMGYFVLCLTIAYRYFSAADREAEVWGFRLVALAGVLFAAGWLGSI
jgi:4-hydroxybenzoate polyprenyltransferase